MRERIAVIQGIVSPASQNFSVEAARGPTVARVCDDLSKALHLKPLKI
jgi:hypothetical protein